MLKHLLTITLLTITLLGFAGCSQASDWEISGNFAASFDTSGYDSQALLFVTRDGDVSLGFTFYDHRCDGYVAKLKHEPIHLFNGEPIQFKSQCIAEDRIAFIPTYDHEAWSMIRQFRQGETMEFSALAKRYVYTYSAVGFTKAYDHVYEKSLKFKEKY